MFARLTRPALLLAATAALGACTTLDPYGYGGTSVSVGVSSGGYYPYRYSPYSYYGWYDGYYYPGAGYYIYDSYGRRHRWSDRHRHYWEGRRDGRRDHGENWGGYRRDRDGRYHDGDRGGRGEYSRGRGGNDRGNWQRRGDRDNRGDRGNWQRRDSDGDRGNRGNWQRRDNDRGETAGQRQSAPSVARPQRQRTETPRATRPETRATRPEARNGRPAADRGRLSRRGNKD